jgi:peptidoglycan/LPS O-acetylase OafA/YrhL
MKPKRIPALDGLRGISIALVVSGHWLEPRLAGREPNLAGAAASLGVRIFFLLSGYLVTRLLLEERAEKGSIDLLAFYRRRARRILPASTCFMLTTFILFRHELSYGHALAAALYVTNFDPGHPWFLGHLWSLSVEEQFYAIWPAAMKKWRAHLVPILLATVGFTLTFRLICGLLRQHGRWDETFPAQAAFLAAGCLMAARGCHVPVVYWLAPRPLVWLGKISYSLYLWQQLFVFGSRKPWYGVLIAVALASLSYYVIERPALTSVRTGRKVGRKKQFRQSEPESSALSS